MKVKLNIFKTFPEFSELTLADKDQYNTWIASYPPFAEFSFTMLMTWWNSLNRCKIAELNGNLVISYWFPGDDKYSGLSVIGTRQLDETFATVLDYLKQEGKPARLVHIPEFVASNLRYPELFSFKDERDYDECIISVKQLATLEDYIHYKRWKIRRFLTEVDQDRVSVVSLDLNVKEYQDLLLRSAMEWPRVGLNNICQHERDVLPAAIRQAEALGMENVCVFIDGEIHNFNLYEPSADPDYVIMDYARFSYAIPHIFEFAAFKTSQWLTDQGVKYINIKDDLGLPKLRANKLALRPASYLRKYTVTPV